MTRPSHPTPPPTPTPHWGSDPNTHSSAPPAHTTQRTRGACHHDEHQGHEVRWLHTPAPEGRPFSQPASSHRTAPAAATMSSRQQQARPPASSGRCVLFSRTVSLPPAGQCARNEEATPVSRFCVIPTCATRHGIEVFFLRPRQLTANLPVCYV